MTRFAFRSYGAQGSRFVATIRRVPRDSTNTCYKIAERVVDALEARGRVVIEIKKRLPVQGGLGGASGNAVTTLLAMERALKKQISRPERLRIAAEVGSDLPLFLIGGTVLGVGRGEEVYPLPDLPPMRVRNRPTGDRGFDPEGVPGLG